MRQIILDTETTGLEPEQGHRIIEIGCVEMVNRRKTGRTFHRYLRPDREVDRGAMQVHGLTNEFLAQQPRFADVVEELIEFISGAELIIHNAAFDLAFLDAELKRLPGPLRADARTSALSSTRCRWRARCIPASATAWTRCASATTSTTRIASCTARCSTRRSCSKSISR